MPVPTSTLIKTEEEERAIRLAEQQQVWERQRLSLKKEEDAQNRKELISFQTPMVDCLY